MKKKIPFKHIDGKLLPFSQMNDLVKLSEKALPEKAVLDQLVIMKDFTFIAQIADHEFEVKLETQKLAGATFHVNLSTPMDILSFNLKTTIGIDDDFGRFLFDRGYNPQEISRLEWSVTLSGSLLTNDSLVYVAVFDFKLIKGGTLGRSLTNALTFDPERSGYTLDANFV